MAGKGEAAINWKPGPAKPPYPLRRKKQILTNHSDKRDSVLKSTTDANTHMIRIEKFPERTGMVRGRGVEPLRPFGH